MTEPDSRRVSPPMDPMIGTDRDRREAEDLRTEALAHDVIGRATAVHRALGPGFVEAVYGRAMDVELRRAGIPFEGEVCITVSYRGTPVGRHRLDLLVAKRVVIELKALPALEPLHRMQVLAYLRATGCRLGYVLNFGVPDAGSSSRDPVRSGSGRKVTCTASSRESHGHGCTMRLENDACGPEARVDG